MRSLIDAFARSLHRRARLRGAWLLAGVAALAAHAGENAPFAGVGPGLEEWQVALALGPSRRPISPAPSAGRQVFVAPDGDDRNPGTEQQPLASLAGAREGIRALKARNAFPVGGVAVVLKPGVFRLEKTLRLTAADSGEAGAPVVYRAQVSGQAVLSGGARIVNFKLVKDSGVLQRLPPEARGKVWQSDLKAQGIADYGTLRVRGFAQAPPPPTLEVYCDGAPMRPARWPNQGFVHASRLLDPGSKTENRPSIIGCDTERLERWTGAKDAWLFGYFRFLWADASLPVGRVDGAARTIATAEPYNYRGLGGADNSHGIRFFIYNLPEEIDEPGEWYLDRASGILYLYPPRDPNESVVEISLHAEPMIVADGVANVRFEGLVFDLGRADGVELKNAENCLFAGCTIRRMAGNGLSILGGHNNVVHSCDVHTIGRRAIEVIGGDRASLAPGGHVVENCHIHHFGRLDRTYTPGIELDGVGHRVSHNLLHDCPSSAVRIEGNDHLIEFNEVRDAVLESEDQGAMELFGNPTYRGVVFRHNLFRDIGPPADGGPVVAGRAALRFDDVICGMLVCGNVFCRAASGGFGAIQINSGRDNVIDRNLFIECGECVTGGWEESNSYWTQLREGRQPEEFFLTETYRRRYPSLAHLLGKPATNIVSRNVAWRCGGAWEAVAGRRAAGPPPAYSRSDRWQLWQNSVLPDDFALASDPDQRGTPLRLDPARLEEIGFARSLVGEIGPYANEYRATVPGIPETTPRRPSPP